MRPPTEVRLSRRTAWALEPSRLARVLAEVRGSGRRVRDLSETNPTRVDLVQPEGLVRLLAEPAGARYEPEPFGLPSARAAVANAYAERGMAVDAARIVIGSSTSEAYAWAFKLLADPGDEVVVPSPSYPLFDYLAGLEGLRVARYPLVPEEGFRVDVDALERRLTDHTRAIVIVAPNNPTGTLIHEADAERIDVLAAERGIAVISDEVFADYVREPIPTGLRRSFLGKRRALTLVMSGLSKECCAPQLKLGWTVVCGPDELATRALERLEVVADTYLSVGTPVQVALPRILASRVAIQTELRARLEENLRALDEVCAAEDLPLRRLASHGGWTALVTVPRILTEEAWVETLARRADVIVQPGYFFDLEDGGTLALSLIVRPDVFRAGVEALTEIVASECGSK